MRRCRWRTLYDLCLHSLNGPIVVQDVFFQDLRRQKALTAPEACQGETWPGGCTSGSTINDKNKISHQILFS